MPARTPHGDGPHPLHSGRGVLCLLLEPLGKLRLRPCTESTAVRQAHTRSLNFQSRERLHACPRRPWPLPGGRGPGRRRGRQTPGPAAALKGPLATRVRPPLRALEATANTSAGPPRLGDGQEGRGRVCRGAAWCEPPPPGRPPSGLLASFHAHLPRALLSHRPLLPAPPGEPPALRCVEQGHCSPSLCSQAPGVWWSLAAPAFHTGAGTGCRRARGFLVPGGARESCRGDKLRWGGSGGAGEGGTWNRGGRGQNTESRGPSWWGCS